MLRFIPPVTRALILVNVAVYLLEMATGNALIYEFALWPINPGLWQGPSFEPIQLVTYSFLHGSIPHLAFNMLALYMFGSDVERLLGTQRYTTLYFAAVIAAALTGDFDAERDALAERTRALMDRYPLYPQLSPAAV